MAKKRNTLPTRNSRSLDKRVENILKSKLDHYLTDISFRIGQEYELAARRSGQAKGTIYAEDLNVKDRVYLTGYTMTNNSPAAGSIAWADLHVVVDGVDTLITNGSTALKYVYFTKTVTPTVLKTSAGKPALAEGDVLLFINEGGVARNMLSDTNGTLPRAVATNAIDTDAIALNAVTHDQILDGAVQAGTIAAGAINNGNLFSGAIIPGANIVADSIDSGQIKTNAVTANELAAGSINATNKFSGNIIPGAQLIQNSVNTTQLASGAVDGTILKAGAINNVDKFSGKIVTGAVMQDGTVSSTQLGSAAVTAAKMNIMRHVMY